MKKKKKIYSVFSFLLAGALCLSMTACSKTPTPAEDETVEQFAGVPAFLGIVILISCIADWMIFAKIEVA